VGVAFDADARDLGVLFEDGRNGPENEIALGKDDIAVELELNLLRDLDLICLDASRRAAVGLRIIRSLAGHVGARVFGIDDAVLVAIRWAAVGLGVVGLDAGYVGARVFGIDDAVLVAIRWATVGLGVVGL